MLDNAEKETASGSSDTAREPTFVITANVNSGLPDLVELWKFRHLVSTLVERNLRVRFKNTALGVVWIVLAPAVQMGIYTTIFGVWAKLPSGGVPYAVFVLSGLIQVFFINAILSGAAGSVRANSGLSKKMHFPKLILPFIVIFNAIVDYGIALALLAIVMLIFSTSPPSQIVLFPLVLFALLFMLLGLAIFLTALGVRFRDVSLIMPSISMLIVYLSPVIYPISIVPERFHLLYAVINPFVGYISAIKWTLAGVEPFHPWMLAISIAVSFPVFFGAIWYFVRTEKDFNDFL